MTERRHIRLLEPGAHAEQAPGPPEAVRLPVELIDGSPANPRTALLEIPELAASIREFGLLQPVAVRRRGERYELIAGHRRFAAISLLRDQEPLEPQWRTIPAVVKSESDDDRAQLMLISAQVHSKAWAPQEEAAILEDLARTMTFPQIGAVIHMSPSWISHRLKVYGDAVLSAYVQTGRLTVVVANELRFAKDPEVRRDLAEQAVAHQWSKTEARAAISRLELDKQLREIGRRTLELIDLLSVIEPSRIPVVAFRDLQVLRGRIEKLSETARGGGPVFPSLEAAEKKARVNPAKPAKSRRTRLKID